MEKIIFLDIDGVIATPYSLDESGIWTFTDECQDNLEYLLKKTGAKLVISSSWRKNTLDDTLKYFQEKRFRFCSEIIGITIRAYQYIEKGIHLSIPRGVEIKQWIDTHIHSENGKNFSRKKIGIDYTYCILDDDTDMLLEQKNYFVNTDSDCGLTILDVDKAVSILNERRKEKLLKRQ